MNPAKFKLNNVKPVLVFSLLILAIIASACSQVNQKTETSDIQMAPMSMLPEEMRTAPVTVRESYQFAVANPDILKEIPCYCGCGPMGHTSNYSCYVQDVEGSDVIFDSHALGCGICVDITQDTMRMLREDKTVAEIRAAVDEKYSKYGPTNMP